MLFRFSTREFVKDLLTIDREKALRRWQKRGLKIDDVDFPTPKDVGQTSQLNITPNIASSTISTSPQASVELGSTKGSSQTVTVASYHKTVTDEEKEQQEKGWIQYNNEGSREESLEHRELKEKLATNPFLLGSGLRLVEVEYKFRSGDRVDILLEDSNGMPIAVEVETSISNLEVGLWQAIKYKHLIAVERRLVCDQARSILVAPTIPDNIKARCFEVGVEPKEIF